jgi:hypothetical protein
MKKTFSKKDALRETADPKAAMEMATELAERGSALGV